MFRTTTSSKRTSKIKIREKIFTPKTAGFTGNNKPHVLILKLSYDNNQRGSSVKYTAAKNLAMERGCVVINNCELVYEMETGELNQQKQGNIISERFIHANKPITIWLEAHGVPGWLYGTETNFDKEEASVVKFSDRLFAIEQQTGFQIENILLNSCYSAAEIINENTGEYTLSSARLLSILMPDKNVIGFIGSNGGSKVTHIFEMLKENSFKLCTLPFVEGSVVFRNGKAVEYSNRIFYIRVKDSYTREFILESCSLSSDSADYLMAGPAKEKIEMLRKSNELGRPKCFADQQFLRFENKRNQREEKENNERLINRP